eukprot:356099-Rhodomonas_salina.1
MVMVFLFLFSSSSSSSSSSSLASLSTSLSSLPSSTPSKLPTRERNPLILLHPLSPWLHAVVNLLIIQPWRAPLQSLSSLTVTYSVVFRCRFCQTTGRLTCPTCPRTLQRCLAPSPPLSATSL